MTAVTQILITTSLGCLVGAGVSISIAAGRIATCAERIANFVTANPMQDVLVTLGQTDRDLLSNFRRRKPAVKKETA